MKQPTKEKNSLVEVLRFLFALWVLYYHDYVPYKGAFFAQGYLAVEFFFVLSGFFLMKSIDQYTAMPLKEGLFGFLKRRFKSILVPFLIGEIFVWIYSFAFEISYNLFFGYLWYVRDLFLAMTAIFLLRKWIKKDRIFYLVIALASFVAFFAFFWFPLFAWPSGPFRSAAAIPLGIFAALIPPIKGGKKKQVGGWWTYAVGFTVSALGCMAIILLPQKDLLLSYLLVIVGYPCLLYFANRIPCHNRFLNWLGSLSFPIYAFQCIVRVIEACGLHNNTLLFCILMGLVLLYSVISLAWKRKNRLVHA